MSKTALAEFLEDRSRLALKLSSRELGGLFRRAFRVPSNTAALLLLPGGRARLAAEGEELAGDFDLVLAKRGPVPVRLELGDLRSADGLLVIGVVTVALEPALERLDLYRDFVRALFPSPGSLGIADLAAHLQDVVRGAVAGRIAKESGASLHRCDAAGLLGGALEEALERHLFDAGVRFTRLVGVSLSSPEAERRRTQEERRREEERRRVETDERRDRTVRRLAGLLQDRQLQGALSGVPDPKLRGLLYAKLMEDDAVQVTAEDLLAKARDCGDEVVQSIYRALEGLLSNGASVEPDEVPPLRAERIYAAAGSRVFEIDPASDAKPRVFEFPEALRSIRAFPAPGGPILAGGSKQSVALWSPGGGLRRYPLPEGRAVKGGINSVAFDGRRLWATHSEIGLACWETDRPGAAPELLHPELTRGLKTTRAVQLRERRLWFASGPHVFAAPPEGVGAPTKYVSSVESPVSCVAAAARTVFAGTESGAIVCWKADAPDQPVVVVRKREPIVNLALARIAGVPHLLYGCRDHSLRARVIGQALETSYESDAGPVGVLDAASDLLCALDADGRRVLLWKAAEPARPLRSVDLWRESPKPVLDLCMSKAAPRSA
jgi:hypothetical protein